MIVVTDDERGPPNMTVDQQRNRIIATEALKNSEPLAAQGELTKSSDYIDVYRYVHKFHHLPCLYTFPTTWPTIATPIMGFLFLHTHWKL